MKFCQKCGKELHDDAVICTGCGCAVPDSKESSSTHTSVQTQFENTESDFYTYGVGTTDTQGMMITVFLFAFSWQWTDDFYTTVFFTDSSDIILMPKIVGIPSSLDTEYAGQNLYESAIRNTCGIMIILPLIIMYLFCQRYLVQGIERSGLTAD